MKLVSIKDARKQFKEIIHRALKDNEEVMISSDQGNLILISQDDWEQMQESLKLLKDKTALKSLLEGHKTREMGKMVQGKTVSEVFSDLGD